MLVLQSKLKTGIILQLFCEALKRLREAAIVITKPNKGDGIVVIDKTDFVLKLKVIFKGRSKFEHLDPADKYDEKTLNIALLLLKKKGELDRQIRTN